MLTQFRLFIHFFVLFLSARFKSLLAACMCNSSIHSRGRSAPEHQRKGKWWPWQDNQFELHTSGPDSPGGPLGPGSPGGPGSAWEKKEEEMPVGLGHWAQRSIKTNTKDYSLVLFTWKLGLQSYKNLPRNKSPWTQLGFHMSRYEQVSADPLLVFSRPFRITVSEILLTRSATQTSIRNVSFNITNHYGKHPLWWRRLYHSTMCMIEYLRWACGDLYA